MSRRRFKADRIPVGGIELERSRRRVWAVRLTVTLSVCLVAGLVASWMVAGELVRSHRVEIGSPPSDMQLREVTFESKSDATLSGWHADLGNGNGVVVLVHGIRSCRLSMLQRARMLQRAGYSTLLFDMQAHGESDGDQITLGHLERHDVAAAVKFARAQHPAEPLALIGVSLGGASALLASPLQIDALVLESVYSNIESAIHNRVAAKLGSAATIPAALLQIQLQPRLDVSADQLRPIDHIADCDCPVFVMSGKCDLHTTPAETRAMFETARSPKELWLVPDAGHTDLCEHDFEQYRSRVVGFLDLYLGDRATHASR